MHKGYSLHTKHRHQLRQYIGTEVSLITHSGLPPPTGAQFFPKASNAPPISAEALYQHVLFLLSHFPPTPPPSLEVSLDGLLPSPPRPFGLLMTYHTGLPYPGASHADCLTPCWT